MIYLRYKDMDCAIRGFTRMDCEGNYCIVLNSRYPYCQNQLTLEHELRHIYNRDFDKMIPAHLIERNTNG